MVTEKDESGFLSGILAGGVLGAALGLLFAPGVGSATREKIAAKFSEFQEDSDKVVAELKTHSEQLINQTKTSIDTGLNHMTYIIAEAKAAAQAKKTELEKMAETPNPEDNS
ncbi:MAG: YtxH domain-containing protein [Candidatus Margulisiibacteriota bacterium]